MVDWDARDVRAEMRPRPRGWPTKLTTRLGASSRATRSQEDMCAREPVIDLCALCACETSCCMCWQGRAFLFACFLCVSVCALTVSG